MPRRAAAPVRPIPSDPVYHNRLVQQVINKVMLDGKKATAEKIVYDALAIIAERTGKNPVEQLEGGIKALTPVLEVRPRRVRPAGSITLQRHYHELFYGVDHPQFRRSGRLARLQEIGRGLFGPHAGSPLVLIDVIERPQADPRQCHQ